MGLFSFPFQAFIGSPPCHTQNKAQEETSDIYQYDMNPFNDKFNIMTEINILFLTQLSREKKKKDYCQIPH